MQAEALRKLEATLPGFEPRPAQVRMMELVASAFRDDGVAAIEAPTGTGKTFAYLAPAIRFAFETGERVVVSTQTIALQEQILGRDLPLVARALGVPVQATLLKGRGNYLCRRKVVQALGEEPALFTPGERGPLLEIARWVEANTDGSRAELGFLPPGELWDSLKSDRDSCLRTRCPHHARCFYYRARRAAQQAQILVVNHHLLFADLAIKAGRAPEGEGDAVEGVLPAWKRVIFDEAHHLEEVASSWFGAEASRLGLTRTVRRLTGDRALPGLLPSLRHALLSGAATREPAERAVWMDAADRIERRLVPFARWLEETRIVPAFSALGAWARLATEGSREEGEARVRVPEEGDERWEREVEPFLGRLVDPPEGISGLADELRDLLRVVAQGTAGEGGEPGDDPSMAGARVDLSGAVAVLERAASAIGMVARGSGFDSLPASRSGSILPGSGPSSADFVRWVEVDSEGRSARLVATPIDLAPFLAKHLFGAHPTVVLSSATLFGGSDPIARAATCARLGLDRVLDGRVVAETLPSPFDWERQALLLLPADLPPPETEGWADALPERVLSAVEASSGGALVLFTSLRLMERVHATLAPRLAALGLPALKQGEADRGALLRRFRAERSAVLFGSDSFWEGVDVPGEALRNVVITRLPFRMPRDPVLVARAERRAAEGGDPFAEITVPAAVIKLRQGLGRLIRTRSDRGLLVILDSRVLLRPYGRRFLEALPPCRVESGESEAVFRAGREFLEESAVRSRPG